MQDAAVHARVIEEVAGAASELGLTRVAMTESPITGAEGNREFFLHLATSLTRAPGSLTAKPRLGAASGVLAELAGWLEARNVRRSSRPRRRRSPASRPDGRPSRATNFLASAT